MNEAIGKWMPLCCEKNFASCGIAVNLALSGFPGSQEG